MAINHHFFGGLISSAAARSWAMKSQTKARHRKWNQMADRPKMDYTHIHQLYIYISFKIHVVSSPITTNQHPQRMAIDFIFVD